MTDLQTAVLPADDRDLAWESSPVSGLEFVKLHPDRAPRGCLHAFSVDVEDWQQSVFDHSLHVSKRFIIGTRRILNLLDRTATRATFFVLGNVAEAAPELIRELAEAGHEVQTHGYDHTEVQEFTPEAFRSDLLRAKGILEDLLGRAVVGYRAPRFSITRSTAWAIDVLAECGFEYDSSIFPMRIRGYGIAGWPRGPHLIRTAAGSEIVEIPVATGRILNQRLPLGGGGYFRTLPLGSIIAQLRRNERRGLPAVLYCHPHEFDPEAFAELPFKVPIAQRIHQGVGRKALARKMAHVLERFSFGPIGDLVAGIRPYLAVGQPA